MEKLLTEREAAERLGYSRHTLRQSRYSGFLAGVRRPDFIVQGKRSIRYRESGLNEWLSRMGTEHTAEYLH